MHDTAHVYLDAKLQIFLQAIPWVLMRCFSGKDGIYFQVLVTVPHVAF